MLRFIAITIVFNQMTALEISHQLILEWRFSISFHFKRTAQLECMFVLQPNRAASIECGGGSLALAVQWLTELSNSLCI